MRTIIATFALCLAFNGVFADNTLENLNSGEAARGAQACASLNNSNMARAGQPEAPSREIAEDLEEGSRLQVATENLSEEWGDGNISTGTTRIRAGRLNLRLTTRGDALKRLSESNFKEEFEWGAYSDRELPGDVPIKTKVKAFTPGDIKAAVEALAQGNAYSPEYEEGRAIFRDGLKEALSLLGSGHNLYTLVSKAKIPFEVYGEEEFDVYSIMFLNKNTKKALRIFVIEGTM